MFNERKNELMKNEEGRKGEDGSGFEYTALASHCVFTWPFISVYMGGREREIYMFQLLKIRK